MVRRLNFMVTKQNPMMKLRAIVKLKEYKDGREPRSRASQAGQR